MDIEIIDDIYNSNLDTTEKYTIIFSLLRNNRITDNEQILTILFNLTKNKSNKVEIITDILSTLLEIITISKLLDIIVVEWYGKNKTLKNICIHCFIKNVNLDNLYEFQTLDIDIIEEILIKKISEIYNYIYLSQYRQELYSNTINKSNNTFYKLKLQNDKIDRTLIDINYIKMELELLPSTKLKMLLFDKFNNIKHFLH